MGAVTGVVVVVVAVRWTLVLGLSETKLANDGGYVGPLVRARGRTNRENDEGDASRLWAVESAEAEMRCAPVLGTSVDWSPGCWRVRKVWEDAGTTAPRLRAAVLVLGGSWTERGSRSVSKSCLTPCFDRQIVERKLCRVSSGWKLMIWAHWERNTGDCGEGNSPKSVAGSHLEAVRLATLAGGLLILNPEHKPGRLGLWSMTVHSLAIRN